VNKLNFDNIKMRGTSVKTDTCSSYLT